MKIPKRITPEQYRALAALGMPVWADSCIDSNRKLYMEAVLLYLLDEGAQADEREIAEQLIYKDYEDYFTLVDTDDEA